MLLVLVVGAGLIAACVQPLQPQQDAPKPTVANITNGQPRPLTNSIIFVRQTVSNRSFASLAAIFGNLNTCDDWQKYSAYFDKDSHVPKKTTVTEKPAVDKKPAKDKKAYAKKGDFEHTGNDVSRGNLFKLDPDGTLTNLTQLAEGAVRDPEISPDGTSVLFAMRTRDCASWQIYEMGVDGTQLRQISQNAEVNDVDPAYLPDGRIIFASDRLAWADSYKGLTAAQLHIMDADGSNVTLFSNNPSGQFNPQISSDGMIYFTQWDTHFYEDLCKAQGLGDDTCPFNSNRFTLWKVHLDGSREGHPAFGQHLVEEANGFTGVRELPWQSGTFIASFSSQTCFGSGPLTLITPDQNLNFDLDKPHFITEPYPNLGVPRGAPRASRLLDFTDSTLPRYRDPYPLVDGRFIASYAAENTCDLYADSSYMPPEYRLVLMNADGSAPTVIYTDTGDSDADYSGAEMWNLQPVEVASRTLPNMAEGSGNPEFAYGILNALDVYNRGVNCNSVEVGDCQPSIMVGGAAKLRVFMLERNNKGADSAASPQDVLLGDVPIEADGSFAAVVPALTPLIWQVLDANDTVLVTEPFVSEVAMGEVRQCSGCHAPHDGRLGNVTNMAIANPVNLTDMTVDTNGNGVIDLLEALDAR